MKSYFFKNGSLITAFLLLSVSGYAQQSGRGHGGGHPPHMNLTDTQKSCLEGILGKPGEGTRPTREAMEAAFTNCNIEKPERPQGNGQDAPPPPPSDSSNPSSSGSAE